MDTRRIKILFLIDELQLGGTEKQLLFLTENLPRDSFEPIIAVLNKTNYQATLKTKTPIVSLNWRGFPLLKNLSLLLRLKCYLETEKFDILQTHFIEATIYGAWAARFCRHRPFLITTRRNLYHWVNGSPLSFRLFRNTVGWTDKILVNSHKIFEECQKMEGIPSDKIALIQNAVEVEKFNRIAPEEAKRSIGLDRDFIAIGVVANWRPIKGLRSFLEAAGRVSQEIPNAHFVLMGHGPQEAMLKTLALNLGIHERITFLENSLDIPTVMASFDIAVQPSLSESFSNVLVEYMAANRPIVATRVGDAETVIENGKNGLLVQAGNPKDLSWAILSLINNRDKAARMGQLAREKVVANWSSNKILMKYQLFYEQIAEQRGHRI